MADVSNGTAPAEGPDNNAVGAADPAQKTQMGAMLAAFGSPARVRRIDEVEPDEPEVESEEAEDAPPSVEEPTRPEASDELIALRKEIADLKAKQATPEAQENADVEATPAEEQTPVDFVSDEEFAEVFQDRDKLNSLLQRVANSAQERVLAEVPRLVDQVVARQATTTAAVNGFYDANEDLLEHSKYVGYIANQMLSESPGKNLSDLLPDVAARVRKDLKIVKKAEEVDTARRKTPAFADTTSGGRGGKAKEDIDPQQAQMLKMAASASR